MLNVLYVPQMKNYIMDYALKNVQHTVKDARLLMMSIFVSNVSKMSTNHL